MLPDFLVISPIFPENKDYHITAVSNFLWEVEELGSTIRKADREALKAFITNPVATVRVPYGHHEIKKPVTCSFIGTLNPEGGFLTDPTGNSRFWVCTLEGIDWNYSKDMDINQIWAQAVAMSNNGVSNSLEGVDIEKMNTINQIYEVEDTLQYYIEQYFTIEKNNKQYFTPTAVIIDTLKNHSVNVSDTDRQIATRISAIMTKFELNNARRRTSSGQTRGWEGIVIRGQEPDLIAEDELQKELFGS